MRKPHLTFWQIWNMSFGFLGIQFGFGLQLANMSAIYAKLGAEPDKIPILWLAGPMTGLIVQPIIGSMSDRTWNKLGRRRPYFLVGAILSSIALFFMPDAPILWVAAGMLWILDASINVSMEPFRAFVADKLNMEQRTAGFVMQSFFIGVGAAVANALPSFFKYLGVTGQAANGVPLTVQYSFKLGAVVFLLAVLWTVLTTKEYPPADMEEFERTRRAHEPFRIQPAFVVVGALAGAIFGATDPKSPLFDRGTEFGGQTFAIYSIVCFAVAFVLPSLARLTSRKTVHSLALLCGAAGLLATYFIHNQILWKCTMIGVGIAWASILSMPYAILSGALPAHRTGVYMGIFNFFIVIPEILASLALQPVVKQLFNNDPVKVVMLGGASLLVAALVTQFVREPPHGRDVQLDEIARDESVILSAVPPESPVA